MKTLSPSAVPAFGGILSLALCALTQTLRAAPGDPDLTFGTKGVVPGPSTSIGLQSDGKIVAVSGQTVRRFLPNGTADASFTGGAAGAAIPFPASTHERALAVQANDKIVVTGSNSKAFAIQRLNADGTPDNTFGTQGVTTHGGNNLDEKALGVLLLPDGNLAVVGTARRPYPEQLAKAITLDASGNVINSAYASLFFKSVLIIHNFAFLPAVPGYPAQVFIAAQQDGGGIKFAQGRYYPVGGNLAFRPVEVDSTSSFLGDDEVYAVAARTDGSVLVTGSAGAAGSLLAGLYRETGTDKWQDFRNPVVTGHSFAGGKSMVLQPDGRIILAGDELARFMPDGNLDPSFRTLGVVRGVNTVALQSDGKILTAGTDGLRRFEGTTVSATMTVEFPAGTPFEGGGGTPVDFGSVSPGATAAKTFTVRNTSTLPLQLWKTAVDGAATAGITTDKTFPLTIAPGASTTITVQWAPAAPGSLNGILHLINSDSTKRSFDIFLTGTSPAPGPEVAVRLDGTTALTDGQSSIIRLSPFRTRAELAFTNAGSAALNFTPVQIDGHATAFTYTSPLPATLPAAASHTTIVDYAPGNQPVSATLHFGSNDADENPFDIAITGDPSTSSATWRDSWFSGAPPGAPTGDTQDYDADGVPNLLEYATFGNPVEPAGLNAVLVKKGNLLEYTITRPLEASTELLYEFEWTDALTTGPWKTLGTNATVVSQDDSRQRVEFTVASSTGRRYVRLKVTRVP